jgi:hypothetical protein
MVSDFPPETDQLAYPETAMDRNVDHRGVWFVYNAQKPIELFWSQIGFRFAFVDDLHPRDLDSQHRISYQHLVLHCALED